jgi:hypothetical protein
MTGMHHCVPAVGLDRGLVNFLPGQTSTPNPSDPHLLSSQNYKHELPCPATNPLLIDVWTLCSLRWYKYDCNGHLCTYMCIYLCVFLEMFFSE